MTNGPLTVTVDADDFQYYDSGLLQCSCYTDISEVNHDILLIGYGTMMIGECEKPYLIVRNSWTKDWGMGGDAYVTLGPSRDCGILLDPFQITLP